MLVLLRSKHAALLYDGKKTEDNPYSQKGKESECAAFPSFLQGDLPHLQGFVDLLPHYLQVPVHFAGCKCLFLVPWLRLEGLHESP